MALLNILGGLILIIELIYFLCWSAFKFSLFLMRAIDKTASFLLRIFPGCGILKVFQRKFRRVLNVVLNRKSDNSGEKSNNSWEAGKMLNFTYYRKKKKLSTHHTLII